jgi:hypothetical protein
MDAASLVFGLIPVAIGVGTLLATWAAKDPASSRAMKMLCWPRPYHDRKQLALAGLFFCAFGALILLSMAGASIYLLTVAGLAMFGFGLAARLRLPVA